MAAHTLPLPNQPPTPALGGVKGPAPALLCTEMELSDCSGGAHFATAGAGAFELMGGGDAELPEAEEVTLTLPPKRKRSSGRRVGASSPKALLPPGEGGGEGEAAPGAGEEEDGGAGKKFRGVWLDKKRNKYKTRIWLNGRTVFLGSHTEEEEAARAYDQVAINRGGLSAFTNFPASSYDVDALQATPLATLVLSLRGQATAGRIEAQSSRHRGVCKHRQSGKWAARLQNRGTKVFLGLFDSEAEAAAAFDAEAARLGVCSLQNDLLGLGESPLTPRASCRRQVPSLKSRSAAADAEGGECDDTEWRPAAEKRAKALPAITLSSAAFWPAPAGCAEAHAELPMSSVLSPEELLVDAANTLLQMCCKE